MLRARYACGSVLVSTQMASTHSTKARGRPRASGESTSGLGSQEDILRAAALLFCTVGYSSTSTHAIAREAGLRQSSIYHYFESKHEILLALLLETVGPSLEVAEALLRGTEPATARLWALCFLDARLLASGPVNLGALYVLPELSDPKLAGFTERRGQLRDAYRELIAQCGLVAASELGDAADMVLALVESVILRRREATDLDIENLAPRIADAALRVLAIDPSFVAEARENAAMIVARFNTTVS
jgi:AcrR family transcriptional regulator